METISALKIKPESVIQSGTYMNMDRYQADNAIDNDLNTRSSAVAADGSGGSWLQINLDKSYCVETVVKYNSAGENEAKWSCSKDHDCLACQGSSCPYYALIVTKNSVEEENETVKIKKEYCHHQYGDTVILEAKTSAPLYVNEIAVFGETGIDHLGKITFN